MKSAIETVGVRPAATARFSVVVVLPAPLAVASAPVVGAFFLAVERR